MAAREDYIKRSKIFKSIFPVNVTVTKEMMIKVDHWDTLDCYGARILKEALKQNDIVLKDQDHLSWGVYDGSVAFRRADKEKDVYIRIHSQQNGIDKDLMYDTKVGDTITLNIGASPFYKF
jgi:hypothetical protein